MLTICYNYRQLLKFCLSTCHCPPSLKYCEQLWFLPNFRIKKENIWQGTDNHFRLDLIFIVYIYLHSTKLYPAVTPSIASPHSHNVISLTLLFELCKLVWYSNYVFTACTYGVSMIGNCKIDHCRINQTIRPLIPLMDVTQSKQRWSSFTESRMMKGRLLPSVELQRSERLKQDFNRCKMRCLNN